MITADSEHRARALAEVQKILANEAAPEDRELLAAFAPVVLDAMPDALALRLEPPALAARMRQYFQFVARTVTPPFRSTRVCPAFTSSPETLPGRNMKRRAAPTVARTT